MIQAHARRTAIILCVYVCVYVMPTENVMPTEKLGFHKRLVGTPR